jgi:hypothetical protein
MYIKTLLVLSLAAVGALAQTSGEMTVELSIEQVLTGSVLTKFDT